MKNAGKQIVLLIYVYRSILNIFWYKTRKYIVFY